MRTVSGQICHDDALEHGLERECGTLRLLLAFLHVLNQVLRHSANDGKRAIVAFPPVLVASSLLLFGSLSRPLKGSLESSVGRIAQGFDESLPSTRSERLGRRVQAVTTHDHEVERRRSDVVCRHHLVVFVRDERIRVARPVVLLYRRARAHQ